MSIKIDMFIKLYALFKNFIHLSSHQNYGNKKIFKNINLYNFIALSHIQISSLASNTSKRSIQTKKIVGRKLHLDHTWLNSISADWTLFLTHDTYPSINTLKAINTQFQIVAILI